MVNVGLLLPCLLPGETRAPACRKALAKLRGPPASPRKPSSTSGSGRRFLRRSWTKLCTTWWKTAGEGLLRPGGATWRHSWALLPSRPLGLVDPPCGWASPALAAAPKYSAICEKVEIGEKGLFFPGLMSSPPPAANTTRRRLCSWIRLMGQSWPLCWVRVWRLLGVPGGCSPHPSRGS